MLKAPIAKLSKVVVLSQLGGQTRSRQSNIDRKEVTSSDFFYEDVTCTARLYRKLRNVFGETISFSHGLGYIHVHCVIRWGLTYSFSSLNFSNRAISEKLIAYLLYSALYPCKYWKYPFCRSNLLSAEIKIKVTQNTKNGSNSLDRKSVKKCLFNHIMPQ